MSKQPVAVKDILGYKFLSSLVASPDKKKVAFVVSECDEVKNSYSSYVYLMDLASRELRRMTNMGNEATVFWLNDETLLFPSNRDEALEQRKKQGEEWTCYYALKINGGEACEYMRIPKNVSAIKLVDSNRFAFIADYNLVRKDLCTYEPEEQENLLQRYREQEGSYLVADEIPFRQNGPGLTNNLRSRLYLFDRSNSSLQAISAETENVGFFNVKNNRIIYSPKHFRKGEPKIFQGGLSIYDVDSQVLHEYVDDSTYRMRYCGFIQDRPVFMGSKGERYYYQENPFFYYIDELRGKEVLFAENELSTENSIGSDVRYGSSAHILTDDQYLYYLSTINNHGHLMRVDLEGRFTKMTLEGGSVDGIALGENEIIMVAMRGNRLQELYSLKDGKEERLTSFNEWVQTDCTLSTAIEISFENDGVMLDGMVLPPVNHKKGEAAPCILDIHGGHKCAYGTVFFQEMQIWANLGYYVIFCNPRGSDGRDNEFFEITGKYGLDDYSDILKFVEVCTESFPDIDSDKMGVTGGSYGGFLTNWIIGHIEQFKCAVSQRSISSWATMFLNSDTSYQFPMYQPDSDIWDNIESYWNHSPLKYADKCTTPTLFLHSDEDYRCPVSEAVQMFTALKYNGIESRLCVFKGENHELSRSGKPKNRINRLNEMTAWFEKYLK
ncbi:MAG: S9 family peptidase [Eubacteriales bacterium]|nr:S9 family peptidase [Eubacteriales bacterium]